MTSVILQQPTEAKAARKTNRGFIHGLITNKKAMTGMAIMLVFIVLALAAPVLFPDDPSRITGMASLEPDSEHWLGTTAKGDAGTPAISDPGAVLVQEVVAAGYRVLPLPGPSSAVAALSVAGDTTAQGFAFAGFLPTKAGERRTALQDRLVVASQSQILFEAPHRIVELVALLAELAPARRVTVCRELTKQFESVHTAEAATLPAWLAADAQRQRGEFVLVLHAVAPPAAAAGDELPPEVQRVLGPLVAELPLKQAVALAVQITGEPRNRLYDAALALKNEVG